MNSRNCLLDADPPPASNRFGRWISPLPFALAALIITSSPISAQRLVDEDEIQVLSPFTVVADEDQGYMATQTLSGSRMNVPLFITSAPVNVFTKQFLDDLGATDVAEAYTYNLSVQPTRQDEQSHNFRSEIYSDTVLRMRGLDAVTARNYFSWNALSDNYNVERLDFSRGPNNILFGTAGFGGVVNVSTKQAIVTEDLYNVTVRVGDWDLYRAAIDANYVIQPNKLGVRLNALWHEEKGWQNHRSLKRKALHAAVTYIPFQGDGHRTLIRGEFEILNVDQVLANQFPFMEGWSAWDGQGVVADGNPTGVQGVVRNTATVFAFNQTDQTVVPVLGSYRTVAANHPTGVPFDYVSREFQIIGNGNVNNHSHDNWTIWVEQQLFEDFFMELAYNHQFKRHEYNDMLMHNAFIDADLFLSDGVTPNPRFGEVYSEHTFPQYRPGNTSKRFELRYTASYRYDSGNPWLGSHMVAGMASRFQNEGRGSVFQIYDVDEHLAGNNNARAVWIRRYHTPGDGLEHTWWDPIRMFDMAAAQGHRWGYVQTSFSRTGQRLDTLQLTWVGRFMEDRLVTTGGVRRNKLVNRRYVGTTQVETNDRLLPVQMQMTGAWEPWQTDAKETTYTYGVTVAPIADSPLRLYYNFSEVFVNQGGTPIIVYPGVDYGPPARSLYNETLPSRVSDSNDYGMRFRLFEGRLAGSLGAYETIDSGAMASIHGWSIHALNFVITTLMNGEYQAVRGTTDRKSTGIEFEMTANPTDNFRLMFNVARSRIITSNHFGEFFNVYKPGTNDGLLGEWMSWVNGWRQGPGETLPAGVTNNTAPAVIVPNLNRPLTFTEAHGLGIDPMYNFGDRMNPIAATGNVLGLQNWIGRVNHSLDVVNLDGMSVLRHRELRANIYGVYAFPMETILKGFSLGGGMKFFDRPIMAQEFDPTGGIQFVYGKTRLDTDAMISYQHRFDTYSMRLQFNIDNVLNRNVVEVVGVPGHASERAHYLYNNPRRLRFTASFDF